MRVRFAEHSINAASLQRLANALDGMNRRSPRKPADAAGRRNRLDRYLDAARKIRHGKLNRQIALPYFT